MLDRSSRFGHPSGSIRRAAFHFPSRSGFGSQPCEDDAVTRDAVNDGNAQIAVVQRDDNKPRSSPASGQPKSTRPAVLRTHGRRSGGDAPVGEQIDARHRASGETQLLRDDAGGAAAPYYSQIR